ncbi:hypothetical protein F5Y05DRAFT_139692 [Hypoxylon sp. FL0543]|nr:hypothetical protein F5Y05DRAFT_139692 [Hypoxylon sp. FL0543]
MYQVTNAVATPPIEGHAGPDAFVTHVPDYPDLRGQGCGLGCVSDPALPPPSYNHSGAPYPGDFASANSCYFRLLSVPWPLEVNMSMRPSSSRGPGSKSSANSFKYDKRISRDDSFVHFRGGAGVEYKPHTFTRGQLPTPETSPRHSPPRKTSIPTVRMPTPESLNEGTTSEIGMALGSPTMNPANGGSRTTPQATLRPRQASTPSLISPASGISSTGSLTRKGTGKWKLFGRFGKKASDHSLAASHEQKEPPRPEQSQDIASQHWYDTRVERSNTVSTRGAPKHKPLVVRSQTMPYDAESLSQGSKSKSSLNDKTQETYGRIPIALDTNENPSGPLLDVEIPSITMERYSVMFGSVLQSQPSLLARRQATVQRLKSIDDAIEKEEDGTHRDLARRATSPSRRSPTFALFPPTPPKKPVHAPVSTSARLRSNTSPAELPSPSRTTFEQSHSTTNQQHQHQQRQHDKPKIHPYKEPPSRAYQKSKVTIATLARARDQHPVARETQFSPDSSNLILESPSDLSSPELEVVKSESVRPPASYIQEPKWQMITPSTHTPSTESSSLVSDRKQPSSSPTSSKHSSKTSDDEDDILENSSKMDPVELSIARQISISRQQRKMLRPLQTTSSRPHRSPSKPTPVPKIAMGKDERLAETKTKTPTLITPEDTTSSSRGQYRKSERVVLDEA